MAAVRTLSCEKQTIGYLCLYAAWCGMGVCVYMCLCRWLSLAALRAQVCQSMGMGEG